MFMQRKVLFNTVTLLIFFSGLFGNQSISIKLEIERALGRGIEWLNGEQNSTSGHWGEVEYPALTALALRSTMGHPDLDFIKKFENQQKKGFQFILSKVQSDGGIYGKGLASYNTSICMMALLQTKNPEFEKIIKSARRFLINQQSDFDRKGVQDNTFDGGVGYGSRWAHSDLSNTHLAMEALYYAKKTLENKEDEDLDLDWDAAISFVTKCQNLPSTNSEKWVSKHKDDKGGFVYFPGSSMAGERENSEGSTALRSYGSMSYAGLLSFIYAEMDKKDQRLKQFSHGLMKITEWMKILVWGSRACIIIITQWPRPYLFLVLMKLLMILAKRDIGKKNYALELLNKQDPKGYWLNENGRWWERDPILVTSYAILTLERIYYSL